jgi:thioredoxin 1
MIEVINIEKFKTEIFDFTKGEEFSFDKTTPVVLNFFGTWCGPCHMFSPVLEDIAAQFEGRLKIFKVDIDQTPELSPLFGIKSVPTTIFFVPKDEPILTNGFYPKETVEKMLSDFFGLF